MSREGRRRLVLATLRIGIVTTVVCGVVFGAWQISRVIGENSRASAVAKAEPVKTINLVTDGTLDRAWVVRTLALPKNATLLELDLGQLRGRVLAQGQVMFAAVAREFPSTLVVRVSERSPVARVLASLGDEAPQPLLVARDGVVFFGVGFDPAMLATLPWLDGVKLTRVGDGVAPIPGMLAVAELLGKAKLEADHLYRNWHIVSLAYLQSDGELEVRTKGDALRVRFATNQDYFRQLATLDWLLDMTPKRTGRTPRRIDLTNGAQVPVLLAPAEPASARGVVPVDVKSFSIPAFPNFSSANKIKREF